MNATTSYLDVRNSKLLKDAQITIHSCGEVGVGCRFAPVSPKPVHLGPGVPVVARGDQRGDRGEEQGC